MKSACCAAWILAASLSALSSQDPYFAYLEKLKKPNGDFRLGEIEIVTDLSEIEKIEQMQKKRLIQKGLNEADAADASKIGIVAEDIYWIWIRDAVLFPKGAIGTYDRLMWKQEAAGAIVLPILPDGRLVLNLNYRHATRSWELELPRGGGKKGETPEETAIRELKEETGMETDSPIFLGQVAADSGVIGAVNSVFLGKVLKQGLSDQEYSEAIADILAFTKEEIHQGLIEGSLEVSLNGKKQKVPLRDSFLTFALLQAELRKLI
jgi:ADP-ribose pyrophosphatase